MARSRSSVAERREELLCAAVEQIEVHGAAAMRIGDIASSVGVSNSLVLYHFSTKEKLVTAAFEHAAERDLRRLRALTARRTTALRRLRAAVRWYAPTGPGRSRRLWIEGWAAALREPSVGEVTRGLDRQWRTVLAELIANGVRAGEFHCPDPVSAAQRLTALLDGLAVQTASHGSGPARTGVQRWADEALDRELGLDRTPQADG